MGALRDFVADLLDSEGAAIEPVEPDGLDVLKHIEKVSFSDGTVLSGLGLVHSDFNGDSNSDVLWSNGAGQVYSWNMSGLQTNGEGGVTHALVTSDWHVQGTGDFNGDGDSDILWRNDSGPVYIWEMDGLQVNAEGGVAHALVTNDWQVQGVGDFDGDTHSDIVWRNDGGQVYIWEMNGPAGQSGRDSRARRSLQRLAHSGVTPLALMPLRANTRSKYFT